MKLIILAVCMMLGGCAVATQKEWDNAKSWDETKQVREMRQDWKGEYHSQWNNKQPETGRQRQELKTLRYIRN